MRTSYKEYREKIKEKQADMEPKEIERLMKRQSEYSVNLDDMKPQEHVWVDRGMKYSCEGGIHPHHEVYKRR